MRILFLQQFTVFRDTCSTGSKKLSNKACKGEVISFPLVSSYYYYGGMQCHFISFGSLRDDYQRRGLMRALLSSLLCLRYICSNPFLRRRQLITMSLKGTICDAFVGFHTEPHLQRVLFLDGGTGEELFRRGVPDDRAIWSATAVVHDIHHETLRGVHRSYVEAGSTMITANSYG